MFDPLAEEAETTVLAETDSPTMAPVEPIVAEDDDDDDDAGDDDAGDDDDDGDDADAVS